jgi:small subunit ribosomal protein S17
MKRKFKGKVTSAKMEKTILVSVETKKEHPIYRKKYRFTSKFMAGNEIGAKEGDYVIIEESSPISKNKKWNAVKVITEKELEVEE